MYRYVAFLLALLFSGVVYPMPLTVTVVTVNGENRLSAGKSFAGITVETKRPVIRAVELAMYESSTLFETLGITPIIEQLELDVGQAWEETLKELPPDSVLILDVPRDYIERIARQVHASGMIAFNVRHSDPSLRESLCLDTLYHTIPSDHMYFDALGQFLVFRGWRKVLLVHGPSENDKRRARLLAQSIKKFGANVVDERTFSLSHHPDDRDENRPDFLTGGVSYDVVAVIDSNKDYGRYLQYSTRSPRPVVGDIGLTPVSWHRTLERYGAPQLNERYRQFKPLAALGPNATMTDAEFAAWSAIKLLSNNIHRYRGELLDLKALLNDPESQVDLYKGTRGSIRKWNNQLRQPMLLATNQAVIAVAPMPKFLHPTHYVDTLGLDEPESECKLR